MTLPLLKNHKIGFVTQAAALFLCAACGSDGGAAHAGAGDSGTNTGTGGATQAGGSAGKAATGGASSTTGGAPSGAGGRSATGGTSGASGATSSAGGKPAGVDAGADATSPDAQPAGPKGECCTTHAGNGCSDPAVEKCVCDSAGSQYCCTNGWNDACVALVGALGCGTCKGSCCSENAGPGCSDSKVEKCVCTKNSDCCSSSWDGFCVDLVETTAGGAACGSCP